MSDTTATPYDPADYNVDEVVAHLESLDQSNDADLAEFGRILQAEHAGKARVGITGHAYPDADAQDHVKAAVIPEGAAATPDEVGAIRDATTAPQRDDQGRPLTTRGATFQDAAEATDAHPTGRFGTSPEADRTGRNDKGLSQPYILEG
jgi:hypothetical protein